MGARRRSPAPVSAPCTPTAPLRPSRFSPEASKSSWGGLPDPAPSPPLGAPSAVPDGDARATVAGVRPRGCPWRRSARRGCRAATATARVGCGRTRCIGEGRVASARGCWSRGRPRLVCGRPARHTPRTPPAFPRPPSRAERAHGARAPARAWRPAAGDAGRLPARGRSPSRRPTRQNAAPVGRRVCAGGRGGGGGGARQGRRGGGGVAVLAVGRGRRTGVAGPPRPASRAPRRARIECRPSAGGGGRATPPPSQCPPTLIPLPARHRAQPRRLGPRGRGAAGRH